MLSSRASRSIGGLAALAPNPTPAAAPRLDDVPDTITAGEFERVLRRQIRLTGSDIAVATGNRHVKPANRWLGRISTGTASTTERLRGLRTIVELLWNSKLLYPDEVGRFLKARNSDLGYARPLVLLGRGEFERVRDAADLLLLRLNGLEFDPDREPSSQVEQAGTASTWSDVRPCVGLCIPAALPLAARYDGRLIA